MINTPQILTSPAKKLIGLRITTNLVNYQIAELWKNFMPRRKEIRHHANNDLVSMAIYPGSYFKEFNPSQIFERWATVEVTDFIEIPSGMETYNLPEGLYAVFNYKGLNTDNSVYQYIFTHWLPASEFELDYRPHFEILGKKYKNNDPESEEEIWIPIKHKI